MLLHKLRHEYVKRIQNCNALYTSRKNDWPRNSLTCVCGPVRAANHFCEYYSYIMIDVI